MKSILEIADAAMTVVLENVDGVSSGDISGDTNVFELIDSMAIVDLIMETEAQIEAETGRYVPLADETTFDAQKSPFRSWDGWKVHLEGLVDG